METAANSRDMQDADKNDAIVVAVTRDGQVYVNTMNAQKGKTPGKYAVRVLLWVGKASLFLSKLWRHKRQDGR